MRWNYPHAFSLLERDWASEIKKSSTTFNVSHFLLFSSTPPLHRFDNPASVAPSPERQLTYNYLVSVNLWLLLFPDALVCDWTMNSIDLIKGFADPRNLLTLLSYAIIALMSYIAISTENRRKANVLIMVSCIVIKNIVKHEISISSEWICINWKPQICTLMQFKSAAVVHVL